MDSEDLLETTEETSVQSLRKSNIKNLLFGSLVIFVLTFASRIQFPLQSQYFYRRVSEEVFGDNSGVERHNLNQTCYLNTSDPGYILQEKAQQKAAEMEMQFIMFKSIIAMFTNILLGAYSDFIGRKFLFACPITGHFIRYTIITVIIYCDLDLNYFFLSEGVDGLTGGYFTILLAAYAYAADNTPATGSRTMGIAFMEFCVSMGGAASSTAAGYFIQAEGFFYPMLTATLLCLVDVLLVLLLLPERPEIKRHGNSICISPLEIFKRVFGFYLVDGSKIQKISFLLAMIVFIFTAIPAVGGYNIETLFVLNLPFCWSPEMIGYYSTASSVLMQVLGVPLTRLLQCCFLDEVIGIVGSLALASADILQSFAYTDFMMYAVIVVRIPAATIFPIARSILSRMAPPNRQGSLFASIAVIETLCSVVGTPVFSNIYKKTVVIWRGFVFIIMASGHVCAAIFLVIFIIVSKSQQRKQMVNTLSIQQGRCGFDTDSVQEDELLSSETNSLHDLSREVQYAVI